MVEKMSAIALFLLICGATKHNYFLFALNKTTSIKIVLFYTLDGAL